MPSPSEGDLKAVDVRFGAAAAAAGLALTSSGEAVLFGVLLALAGGQLWSAAAAMVAALAVGLRWGATSLEAVAGAQSVLGPAGVVGSAGAVASAWLVGVALVLASPRGWAAPAFGLAAAFAVAGPAVHSPLELVVRAAAAAVGVGLAIVAGHFAPPRIAHPAAVGLASLAALLALFA